MLCLGFWPLGHILCDIWISLDVLLCTASILSLCAISIDRWVWGRSFRLISRRCKKVFRLKNKNQILENKKNFNLFFDWSKSQFSQLFITKKNYLFQPVANLPPKIISSIENSTNQLNQRHLPQICCRNQDEKILSLQELIFHISSHLIFSSLLTHHDGVIIKSLKAFVEKGGRFFYLKLNVWMVSLMGDMSRDMRRHLSALHAFTIICAFVIQGCKVRQVQFRYVWRGLQFKWNNSWIYIFWVRGESFKGF